MSFRQSSAPRGTQHKQQHHSIKTSMSSIRVGLWILAALVVGATAKSHQALPMALLNRARRFMNLSSLLSNQRNLAKTPYERVACHPVFQVTTSFGAPYMNFEKIEKKEEEEEEKQPEDIMESQAQRGFFGGGETRQVTLFYCDPMDAIQMHEEMKQMNNMKDADIRITTTTLAKAIRHSSNLGGGLPTGAGIDKMTGNLPSASDGGSLRYKIVPSKRQLFYAARCVGRERVGLFGNSPQEDAANVAAGSRALTRAMSERRRGTTKRILTPGQRTYQHMDGFLGIPVFSAPEMRKRYPSLKGMLSGTKEENPIFFSYEDLMETWAKMRKRDSSIPARPSSVEVFNLMDVLAAMDEDEWEKKKGFNWKAPVAELGRRFLPKRGEPGLESVTFIPPKNTVEYKEMTSANGNGKARLRPMR